MSATIRTHDVKVGDYLFHLSETGPTDAEAIVWLHGSGPGATALSNWEWMIGELGDTYHCLAPDIIGFGDSTHPDPPPQGIGAFTMVRVDTLLSLLDELGLDSVNLVGNSMGGIISLALTQMAPDRVRRIVLMGSGGAPTEGGLSPGLLKLITFYDNPTAENMAELLTFFVHDPAFFGDRLAEIAAARLPRATRPEVERSHRATFSPGSGGPALKVGPEDLAKITQPTLIVHGDDDKIVPLAAGQYFASHIPNARFEVFADTGHWLQIEQGPRFAALLRSFLADT
jgi:2-hydroxymuconate-semialdehyde hydrolase